MDPVFKKMNFKEHEQTLVLNAPDSFQLNIEAMDGLTQFSFLQEEVDRISFVIAFVTRQDEIESLAPIISKKLEEDGLVWFCYPKKTSKRYTCDFNRDSGWQIMGDHDFEGVRIVAIDQDWSALRFRRVQYIKKMTRGFAMTKEGRKKSGK